MVITKKVTDEPKFLDDRLLCSFCFSFIFFICYNQCFFTEFRA